MHVSHTVFLGIGSNLGDRHANCERAIALLRGHPSIVVTKVAPWREYPALTLTRDEHQPAYLNGVAELATTLTPEVLLAVCQRIEAQLGRRREPGRRWQPRTIDIDILLYDDLTIATPTLTIPHPEMANRPFVMEPLTMIAPHWVERFRVK